MTRTDSFRALMAIAVMALALCLLALVGIKPAELAFLGKQSFMLLLPPLAATALGYAAVLWVLLSYIVVRGGRRQVGTAAESDRKIANPWRQPAHCYRRREV